MNTVVLIIIVGVVVLAAFAVWNTRRRRRASLQERFGPEYEREVRTRGSESAAAQHLGEVADRRDLVDRTLDEIRMNVGSGHTGETMSTEDLRVSFQRYREFFQRLLAA